MERHEVVVTALAEEVLDHAATVCHESGSSFVKCFSLMKPSQRRAMTLFYAFCREVDDLADEEELGPVEVRRKQLLKMRKEITQGFVMARRSETTTVQGVGFLMQKYGIPAKHFVDLIDGMLVDCAFEPMRLWNETLHYCYQVASTVGLVSMGIFSDNPERYSSYAVKQGLALQLVNIYRDFEEDLERNRCYMPLEWLDVSEEDYRVFLQSEEKEKSPLYSLLLDKRELLRFEARYHFHEAIKDCPRTQRRRIWPLLLMGYAYMNLLDQIPVGSRERGRIRPLKVLGKHWHQFL